MTMDELVDQHTAAMGSELDIERANLNKADGFP